MVRGIIVHLVEVSPFGLSKVWRGGKMDIPGKVARQPRVKKIVSSNQDQTNNFLLGKEIIRSVYLTQRKAPRRAGMGWQTSCKGKNIKVGILLRLAHSIRLNQEQEKAANCEQCRLIFKLSCDKETTSANLFWMPIWCTRYSKRSLLWKQMCSTHL